MSVRLVVLLVLMTALNVGILAVNLSTRSQAAVAGMSAAQLKDDKDFKEAVQFIIQKCSVWDRLSINCS